jgi:hypothetical protein
MFGGLRRIILRSIEKAFSSDGKATDYQFTFIFREWESLKGLMGNERLYWN